MEPSLSPDEKQATRERLRIWREAEPALQEQRWRELRALTNESARSMTEALLARKIDPRPRRDSSGLIEQQALFQRWLSQSCLTRS